MRIFEKVQTSIFRDVLGIGLVKILAIPATMVIAMLLARTLGPNNYGIYSFVLSVLNVAALFLTGGIAQLMTREVASALQGGSKNIVKGAIRSAMIWSCGSSLLIVLATSITLLVSDFGLDYKMHKVLLTGVLALPILCLSPVWAGTLRGYGLGAKSQLPGLLIMPMTQFVYLLILYWFKVLTLQSAMLGFLLANIVAAALGLYLMRSTVYVALQNVDAKYRTGLWAKSSVIFTGIALVTYMNTQVGVLLLGFVSSMSDVGAFQIADRGAQLAILSMAIIELVLAPHIARHHKAREKEELQHLFNMSRLVGGAITLVLALPLIFFGYPIVNLFFGADYVDKAVQPLAVIASALVFRVLFGPTSTFLSMTGNEKATLIAQILAVTVNIILTLALAPSMGAVGAAWGSGGGIALWSVLLSYQVKKNIGIRVLFPEHSKKEGST